MGGGQHDRRPNHNISKLPKPRGEGAAQKWSRNEVSDKIKDTKDVCLMFIISHPNYLIFELFDEIKIHGILGRGGGPIFLNAQI